MTSIRPRSRPRCFRLPTTCFAEEDGSLTNSGRWLQWHWKGADGPGESRSDILIMTDLFLRLRELYRKEGGAFPEPVLGFHWPYKLAEAPSPEEIAREINGYVFDDIEPDPKAYMAYSSAAERPLSKPTTAARSWPRGPLFMPLSSHCLGSPQRTQSGGEPPFIQRHNGPPFGGPFPVSTPRLPCFEMLPPVGGGY